MKPEKPSRVTRFLARLADVLYRHRRWFFYLNILLFVFSIGYTVAFLEFSTERNDLVGAEKRYHQNFLKFKEEFPVDDDIVAIVESDSPEKNRQFIERLALRLREDPLFKGVLYKGDLSMLGPKALLFLPEEELETMDRMLREYRPMLETFSQATNLVSFVQLVNAQFRSVVLGGTAGGEEMLQALPALRRVIEGAGESLQRSGHTPSPGIEAFFGAGPQAEQQKYVTYGEGRYYLLTARPATEELSHRAVERMRELVHQTQREVPGVNAGITGETVLEIDEMRQSQEDTAAAAALALVLVALIFIYGYRETGRPLKATLALVFGLAYTLAYATMAVGHLNILTITFVPILIGLAIDYGVHLITRYEEEMRHGATEYDALQRAMVQTGHGIFTACFTTSGAFFAMALTDFKGIQEMGIITGGGMLVCLIPMMTFLPVLLLRGHQNILDHRPLQTSGRRFRLEEVWLGRPLLVLGVTVVISVLAALQLPWVRFDYNLLNMQSARLPAVVFERKLIDSADKSVLYGAVIADSLEEAVMLEDRLEQLPSVAKVESMAPYLASRFEPKLALIERIQSRVESIDFPAPDTSPVALGSLSRALWYLHGYLGLALSRMERGDGVDSTREQVAALREAVAELRGKMSDGEETRVAERLGQYQAALFHDLRDTFQTIKNQPTDQGLKADDLPGALGARFIGSSGKYLLQVFPKENVWERNAQEEFIEDLRRVDPDVTGTPVQLYEYTSLLKASYEEAAWYALGAIVILVFLHFRSWLSVVMALLPVALGTLWMLGLMGWRGVPFNPANIMTLPLVIGIGVTNGIHLLNRFAEEANPRLLAKSTGKAVLVSALTSIAGFGSLMMADHQGIASLGYVMSAGVASCMIAGLLFLPSILHLVAGRSWAVRRLARGPSADGPKESA